MVDLKERFPALKGLDNYWFGHNSPTSIGLFRMIMSSLIFVNLCMIITDFDAWFTERGFVPQRLGNTYLPNVPFEGKLGPLPFDFHFPIPRIDVFSGVSDQLSLAIYIALMVATLLCAFGLWTRVTSIAMAVGLVSLHHRNGLILHGGDTVMRIAALYIAMAPSGAACSLDRIIGLWKGRIKPGPVRVSVWVQRLVSYNTAIIYFTTFWHKYGYGSHWRDMTATWYPARLHEFDRFPVPSFFNELPMVYVTTFGTLVVELALGTIVFYRPLRKYVLLSGIALHAYIDYSMNIPLFSYLMVSLYISFYDGVEVDAWAKKLGARFQRFRAKIFVPQSMQIKTAPAAALDAMDPLDLVTYEAGSSPAWEGQREGQPVNPFQASLVRSIGSWPLGFLPSVWRRLLNGALETAPETAVRQQRPLKAKIKR